ncbi:MAG TPA: glycoside hydrolase family 5 protein, partial [Fibrobacteraceae bacterium]|nr:glycoside hydrolase family 5 protein [Fibrobacteraceae bacterium]
MSWRFIVLLLFTFLSIQANASSIVDTYGQLQACGNRICSDSTQTSTRDTVQLRGVSLGWSNTGWESADFFNANAVDHMADDWKAEIVRAPLGAGSSSNGYNSDSATNYNRVKAVVDEAIEKGLYVIIDWHSHNAEDETETAVTYFKNMATAYGSSPNVIFEVYNEPDSNSTKTAATTWSEIRAYATQVVDTIRNHSNNLILVGTPQWDQLVNEALDSPLTQSNLAYVFHFYANTHPLSSFRSNIQSVLDSNYPVFVSEYGTTNADGNLGHNASNTNQWLHYLDSNAISYVAWHVNDKNEGSAFFASSTEFDQSTDANWTDTSLMSASGQYVYQMLTGYATCAAWRGNTGVDCPDLPTETVTEADTLWDGLADGGKTVRTGGSWYTFDDNNESNNGGPGNSSSDFPDTSTMATWVSGNGGEIDVTFTLGVTTYSYPYVGIGFDFTDPQASYSITDNSGICLTYAKTGDVPITIMVNDSSSLTNYDNYSYELPTQSTAAQLYIPFSDFSQDGWGYTVSQSTALTKAIGINFQAQEQYALSSAMTANLVIKTINLGGCGTVSSSSSVTSSFSSSSVAQSSSSVIPSSSSAASSSSSVTPSSSSAASSSSSVIPSSSSA